MCLVEIFWRYRYNPLTGYYDDGYLNISNVLAENPITSLPLAKKRGFWPHLQSALKLKPRMSPARDMYDQMILFV
jgi:hypothetical protein